MAHTAKKACIYIIQAGELNFPEIVFIMAVLLSQMVYSRRQWVTVYLLYSIMPHRGIEICRYFLRKTFLHIMAESKVL